MSQHDGIHMALAPFRMLCMSTSSSFCHDYDKNGMPKHVAWGIRVLQWFDALDLPIVVQIVLLGSAWLFFGFFMVVEALLIGSIYTPIVALVSLLGLIVVKSLGIRVSTRSKKTV
ncbi:expressed unknown protein [Seminavis robusta]|uniref:Uncharacterized protein n=1 Tax=Seminavis robusta TaxID=568900 RepID=A0A9N8D4T1_9STRA|nr:expressed unknown protein [Seminavis robusta]|eukprot:Sro1_g000530.1 n/a (115) ;mRNA; r:156717-157061